MSGRMIPIQQVNRTRLKIRFAAMLMAAAVLLSAFTLAQTDCATGDNSVDPAVPKNMTSEELIQKFTAEENRVRDARSHYTYTQEVLAQTLNDKTADGQWHEVK